MKELAKAVARGLATLAVAPVLVSFLVRTSIVGRDRAFGSSCETLSLIPGLVGQYMRRAFLARTLEYCGPNAVIGFGVLLSQAGARIDDYAYIGPRCHLGLVHIEKDVLLAAGVHVPSGAHIHGTDDPDVPIRNQPGAPTRVRIGAGTWVGSNAVVLADVGAGTIVGAGAVVTRPLPDGVVAGGVPARILKSRSDVATAAQGR
jgi:virginiamycin A acetyltransferase